MTILGLVNPAVTQPVSPPAQPSPLCVKLSPHTWHGDIGTSPDLDLYEHEKLYWGNEDGSGALVPRSVIERDILTKQ